MFDTIKLEALFSHVTEGSNLRQRREADERTSTLTAVFTTFVGWCDTQLNGSQCGRQQQSKSHK
jgi:hypothetical protein